MHQQAALPIPPCYFACGLPRLLTHTLPFTPILPSMLTTSCSQPVSRGGRARRRQSSGIECFAKRWTGDAMWRVAARAPRADLFWKPRRRCPLSDGCAYFCAERGCSCACCWPPSGAWSAPALEAHTSRSFREGAAPALFHWHSLYVYPFDRQASYASRAWR
jgi:hypothetical protein